jgi:TolB-like protein/tetratricopeptide (TPR) repeat protein
MGEASPTSTTRPSGAVFLSYASQDAEGAKRICEALRAAGIEVWFDLSELRGGEAWDRQIRKQIHDCALFIPVISANAHARVEGYFRLEWKLAVDRSHLMAPDQTFLLPVVIDDTPQTDERIPDRFRELQWSRAPGGQPSGAFVRRVEGLLLPETARAPTASQPPAATASAVPTSPIAAAATRRSKPALVVLVAALAVVLTYIVVDKFWISGHTPPSREAASANGTTATATAPAGSTFNPPPHSIAVLPFVNMSGDKEQEYFSDGLTEEILNALAHVNELQVTARTSSFSFKGKDTDVDTIAHKLNVGAILEGSVRRSGHTVRITTQLVNAVTGFHLWSETFDRDLRDVLKLQTEIATAVAGALKVTLLGDVAMKGELGGTSNPAALDAYLRGVRINNGANDGPGYLTAAANYTEAVRLDPGFARAFAARSGAFTYYAANWATGSAVHDGFMKGGEDARHAVALAPELAEAHHALAFFLAQTLEFRRAEEEYARATALAPGSAVIIWESGLFATQMGRTEAGLAALRRLTELDPLTEGTQDIYGYALYLARRYEAALAAYGHAISLAPDQKGLQATRGLVYYALGEFEAARSGCQDDSGVDSRVCLSVAYEKLGRHDDAQATLERFMNTRGDADFYAYAEIYAQWGDTAKAMEWLEKALSRRDSGFILLKTDPLMDPLRHEPRFQAIMRELNFPQ